jgi:hypothetical protein
MAGFSLEEANEFIQEHLVQNGTMLSMKSNEISNYQLVENFWPEVGLPKGTRWWEQD